MAKPRVFISSTYYDLKQTREDIAVFLQTIGYEAIRNEEGNIPYGQSEKLETYCYKEIQTVDILISIIGGRYGSSSSEGMWSVSNTELKKAIEQNKQVYIFIDKNVLSEYETYLCNKGLLGIKFKYVDNPKIYEFIEEIKHLSSNNNIKAFETSNEIQNYLKEQLAGLFQSFLANQSKIKDNQLAGRLESVTNTLEQLVEYLKESNKDKEDGITKLLRLNHPFVVQLSRLLDLGFGIDIENIESLKSLFNKISWTYIGDYDSSDGNTLVWETRIVGNTYNHLIINKDIFDSDGKLRDFKQHDWHDEWVRLEVKETEDTTLGSDLPF